MTGEPGSVNMFASDQCDLDPREVARRVAAGEALLVDVRELHEWTAGHIPGARHIEIERLAWNAPTLDPRVPIVFYCRLGMRGGLAAHAFRAIGIDAWNLAGGVSAWHEAGMPLEPDGAVVAAH